MEPKLSILIEQAPIGIVTFTSDGVIDYVNQNFEKFGKRYQFETSELLGKNIFEVPVIPGSNIISQLTELTRGTQFEKEIKTLQSDDGSQVTLVIKGSPLYEENKFAGGIIIIEDIKVLADKHEDLKSRSEQIERAIRYVNDFLIVTDNLGDILFTAGNAFRNFYPSQAESAGQNIVQHFNPSIKNQIAESIEKILRSKTTQKFNFELKATEKNFYYECKVEPLLSQRGTIQSIYFFFTDKSAELSERSGLHKKIKVLEYYKSASTHSAVGVFTLDGNGIIRFWDEQLERIFKKKKAEVIGNHINLI
ncbi:MAG TPA: PAS domain S-box protein, partial [Ignavibacteriaceae bacterium]